LALTPLKLANYHGARHTTMVRDMTPNARHALGCNSISSDVCVDIDDSSLASLPEEQSYSDNLTGSIYHAVPDLRVTSQVADEFHSVQACHNAASLLVFPNKETVAYPIWERSIYLPVGMWLISVADKACHGFLTTKKPTLAISRNGLVGAFYVIRF